MKKGLINLLKENLCIKANQLKKLPKLINIVKYEDFVIVFYVSVENSFIFTVLPKKYFRELMQMEENG